VAHSWQKPSDVYRLQPRAVVVGLAGKSLRGIFLLLLVSGLATSPALIGLTPTPVAAASRTNAFPGQAFALFHHTNGLPTPAPGGDHHSADRSRLKPLTSAPSWDFYLATVEDSSETHLEAVASTWAICLLPANRSLTHLVRPRSDRQSQRLYLLYKSLLH
jgi:hypothetical protein